MSTARNGQPHQFRDPVRRLRFDDLSVFAVRHSPSSGSRFGSPRWRRPSHSGRRLVVVAGIVVVVLSGALNLTFRDWKARYRARAAYGAFEVVPAIDRLAAIAPANLGTSAWRDAVRETRSMLTTVISSNLLDIQEMRDLRTELDQIVGRAIARPETAPRELADVWNVIGERGEFLLKDSRSQSGERHPRPRILPSYWATRVVPAIDPLAEVAPPDAEPTAWRDAVGQTHAMLLSLAGTNQLSIEAMKLRRAKIEHLVNQACARPETAVAKLAVIWNESNKLTDLQHKGWIAHSSDRQPRPKLLVPNP
jgi:hypothetical protein